MHESRNVIWITSGYFDLREENGKRLERLFLTAEEKVKKKWAEERKKLEDKEERFSISE
jgi:hypothetical protein